MHIYTHTHTYIYIYTHIYIYKKPNLKMFDLNGKNRDLHKRMKNSGCYMLK